MQYVADISVALHFYFTTQDGIGSEMKTTQTSTNYLMKIELSCVEHQSGWRSNCTYYNTQTMFSFPRKHGSSSNPSVLRSRNKHQLGLEWRSLSQKLWIIWTGGRILPSYKKYRVVHRRPIFTRRMVRYILFLNVETVAIVETVHYTKIICMVRW